MKHSDSPIHLLGPLKILAPLPPFPGSIRPLQYLNLFNCRSDYNSLTFPAHSQLSLSRVIRLPFPDWFTKLPVERFRRSQTPWVCPVQNTPELFQFVLKWGPCKAISKTELTGLSLGQEQELLRQHQHYTWEILKRSFISTVKLTVHTKPWRKQSFSKRLSKPGEFENDGFFIFVWTKHVLKTELFENDDVAIITWFPCSSFPQTKIQNNRWLLRF